MTEAESAATTPTPEREKPCSERIGPQLEDTMQTLRTFAWLLDHANGELTPECPVCLDSTDVEPLEEKLMALEGKTLWRCIFCDSVFIGGRLATDGADLDPYVVDEARDADPTDLSEYAIDRIDSYLLSVDTQIEVHLQFSWGGPADGMRVTLDSDGNVSGGVYYFQDWFDGAERKLSNDQIEIVERVFASQLEYARSQA